MSFRSMIHHNSSRQLRIQKWTSILLAFVLLLLCNLPDGCRVIAQSNVESHANHTDEDFRNCCSKGQSLARTPDIYSPQHNRLDVCGPPTQTLDAQSEKAMAPVSPIAWCQRVEHLCCLATRRLVACRLGAEHITKNGGRECSPERWNFSVEPPVIGVAKECCMCRLVWGAHMGPLTEESAATSGQTSCPGIGCCQMLALAEHVKLTNHSGSVEPIKKAEPKSTSATSTATTATYYMDDPNELDMVFAGGLGISELMGSTPQPATTATTTSREVTTPASVTEEPKCQPNFVWDKDQELCVRLLTACPIGMQFSPTTNRCVPGSQDPTQCNAGYRFNEIRGQCEDINECLEGLPNGDFACKGQDMYCVNLPGSYNCTCNNGFMMAQDGTCVDVNECNQEENPCPVGQQCVNIIGSFQCVRQVPCGYGYVLNPKTQQCEDVNECKSDPEICGRGMMCINVRGGHKCVDIQCPGKASRDKFGNCVPCPTGFAFNQTNGSCEDIDECADGAQCKPWERCVNKRGYFVCEQKLNCEHGFRISTDGTQCEDIDECQEKMFNCGPHEMCVNTNGSYTCQPTPCHPTQVYEYKTKSCVCEKGMRYENGSCVDINECEEIADLCPLNQTCVNHVGGYRCIRVSECPPGFERISQFEPCRDIDECKTGVARCGQGMYCVNTVGSYQCLCERGYKNLDANTCVDVDECTLFGSHAICPDSRARCVNTNGSHMCVCPDGYQWIDYPKPRCTDIDECIQQPGICGDQHQCVNLEGSYKCVCAAGFQNVASQKKCQDIDECSLQQNSPTAEKLCPNSLCVNTPGSYQCRCPDGFRLGRGGFCYDVDECNELEEVCTRRHTHSLNQACVNLMGGYRCVSNQCPPFYNKSRLGNGFRCQLLPDYCCQSGDTNCFTERPQRMDYLYIELDQETSVPQILARVDTKHLPSGIIRADLRQDYANHLLKRNAMRAGKSFQLQRSRTQYGSVEVVLNRPLPAPVDILISLHLLSFKDAVQTGHSITKLYLFVTQSASERVRLSQTPQYQHADFWTQLRYSKRGTRDPSRPR